MKKSTLCAIAGLLIGGLFGALWAFALTRIDGTNQGWTSYPTLSSPPLPAMNLAWQVAEPDRMHYYFSGILWGCGFGAVAGAVVGAAGAIVRAIKESGPKPGPSPITAPGT